MIQKNRAWNLIGGGSKKWSRVAFLEGGLAEVPFQLLPHVVHSAEVLEKWLKWQEEFLASQKKNPRILVFCDISGVEFSKFELFCKSLAVQSYSNFNLVVFSEPFDPQQEFSSVLSKCSFSSSHVSVEEPLTFTQKLASVLQENECDYVLLTSARHLLHPAALFIFAKSIIARKPRLLFSNQLLLSDSLPYRASRYFRRSVPQKYSSLALNQIGDLCLVDSETLKSTLASTPQTVTTSFLFNWVLSQKASVLKIDVEHIGLALYCTMEEDFTRIQKIDSHALEVLVKSHAKNINLSAEIGEIVDSSPEFAITPRILRPREELSGVLVQVVIPFRNNVEVTLLALASLAKQEMRDQLQVTLINNNSEEAELKKLNNYLANYPLRSQSEVVTDLGYFNFARLNNIAARKSDSPFILFMNNDVELKGTNEIRELVSWCNLDDVGAVGGALFYPDGNFQHGGVSFGNVRPLNVTLHEHYRDVFREVNAITFALALVKRTVFQKVSGLDEVNCPNGFGDALFCHEVGKLGYRIIYTPLVRGTHYESLSRGRAPEELELYEMVLNGIPISDLYGDFYSKLQPMYLPFSQDAESHTFIKRAKSFVKSKLKP